MQCPKCKIDLKASDLEEYGFVIIDVCPICDGAWFDKGELDRLDESIWTDVEKIEFHNVESVHKDIKCPKCDTKLEPLNPKDLKELIIDRCPSCQGFWLDKGELDQMKDVAAKVDSEIKKDMHITQKPDDWSSLRWSIYCFKECYFK